MRLADFVSAILHLSMAFELFKAKDANQDNQIKMGLNEVSSSFECLIDFSRGVTKNKFLFSAVDQISVDVLSLLEDVKL